MSSMKALVINKAEGKPGSVYHPATVQQVAIPTPKQDQVLVKVLAGAFNHRDLFIRQSLYPGIVFTTPEQPSIFGADAVGKIVSPDSHPLYNKYVLLAPASGWIDSPLGPDQVQPYGIIGNVRPTGGIGTFAEYICIGKDDLVECPPHFLGRGIEGLSEAASVPLGGLTAYRAVFTKANVQKGQNVLITGIGGGVAIIALQYCVALGANVYVSSSSEEKIARAVKLGAKGGVNYKEAAWPVALGKLLNGASLDAVIDSGGGPIVAQCTRVLKYGGVVACYGCTSGVDAAVGMGAILKNIEFKGCTMGSLAEFKRAIAFIEMHKIKPVVHTILSGLEHADVGFDLMKSGGQFGKIVIVVDQESVKGKL